MRKMRSLVILILVCLPLSGLFSFEPDYLNRVTFVNKTGADIWYVFLSPGDSGEWGFDILGSERVLEAKSSLSFYVLYPDSENNFDIMAIDEDGNTFILYDELFSDDSEIRIVITESALDDENPEMGFVEVEFENQTDYEMMYVFVSPSDSNMWGVDMMDDEQTLGSYETLSLLAPSGEETISYDVMAVDEDNDEYTFTLNVHSDYADSEDVIRIPIEYGDLSD
ncbi:MAG: hypothetical protein JEY91_12380 [Spirochaetaceae bacterium]|nr:hypothetical protein [Spirochaetaceae bacterium]